MIALVSIAAQDPKRQVSLVDISLAYFNAFIERHVFSDLGPKAGYGKNMICELLKSMYGTRDVAQSWEGTCIGTLLVLIFSARV